MVTEPTESVTLLTKQLNELLEVLRPVTAAEHDVERVLGHLPHLPHLLHRQHPDAAAQTDTAQAERSMNTPEHAGK